MEQEEGQTILLDVETFILHQNKSIYFNDGTLSLEFIGHELLSENKTDKFYGFSLLFKEFQNGRWCMRDEYLKIHYWKSLTPTPRLKISYALRWYGSKDYGDVTIMDIKEDTKDFILYLKICNTENKLFSL